MQDPRRLQPGFRDAVLADAQVAAYYRFERTEFGSGLDAALQVVRLMWRSDAFLAQTLYRAKARLQARGIPLLPRLAHRLAMALGQVSIGDTVVLQPGVYLIHGQVVIDGFVDIGRHVVIGPFVTIGLRGGELRGPTIGPNVTIGAGAKILGNVSVGAWSQVGANAVVIEDVPEGTTVVGVPARAC